MHAEELAIARLAVEVGALDVSGPLSAGEQRLVAEALRLPDPAGADVRQTREGLRAGSDPLGDRMIAARSQTERRLLGQVFSPSTIVAPMVEWVLDQSPSRVVDAGCGSGRFAIAVARRSNAHVVAFDTDPLATLVTRAGLGVLGGGMATVVNADFTSAVLPGWEGKTAFIGNPPYVRHPQPDRGSEGVGSARRRPCWIDDLWPCRSPRIFLPRHSPARSHRRSRLLRDEFRVARRELR